MADEPSCLVPYDRRDAISPAVAARIAGCSEMTVKRWAERYGIGRRVVGRWKISRAGLAMLLDNNKAALIDFVAGDQASAAVQAYLAKLSPSRRTG